VWTGRMEVSTTRTEKKLTPWSLLIAILLLFCVPTGFSLASRYDPAKPETLRLFVIGLSVSLTPVLLSALTLIYDPFS
jgi:hypothetical protein